MVCSITVFSTSARWAHSYGTYCMKNFSHAATRGIVTLCLFVSPVVLADEATQLDEVIVTADRKARTVDETLAPVTVITLKFIEKYQAQS